MPHDELEAGHAQFFTDTRLSCRVDFDELLRTVLDEVKHEKDRPYIVLCMFVIRQAMADMKTDAYQRYVRYSSLDKKTKQDLRIAKDLRERMRFSDDAKSFFNGRGLEVLWKLMGMQKFMTITHLRRILPECEFPCKDNHNYQNT